MNGPLKNGRLAYRVIMSLAEEMLLDGIITEADYAVISNDIAQKYTVNIGTIFCEKPLLFDHNRANMSANEGR